MSNHEKIQDIISSERKAFGHKMYLKLRPPKNKRTSLHHPVRPNLSGHQNHRTTDWHPS